jgi:hypothetical protein
MSRVKILLISMVGTGIFIVSLFVAIKGVCKINYFCSRLHDDSLAFIFFPMLLLLIFSLITYKMREDVFQTWWKFSRVWMPLSMLAILIAPSYSSNWMIPIEKGTVAFFSSMIYIITSLVIVVYKKLKG